MTALAADTVRPYRARRALTPYPVKKNATIRAGSIVELDGGYAVAASKGENKTYIGIADKGVTGGTSNGAKNVLVRRDVVARFSNASGGDAIGAGDVGKQAYVVDDNTVTDTSTSTTALGRIETVTPEGIWVQLPR